MKAKYYIDGDGGNATYETLNEVKHHVSFEPQTYNRMYVFRVNDENFYRVIKVTKSGKIILSKNPTIPQSSLRKKENRAPPRKRQSLLPPPKKV